jgi:hypothetical protein
MHRTFLLTIALALIILQVQCSYFGNFALSFDGVNDYVEVSRTKSDAELEGHWTVEWWMKANPDQSTAVLFVFAGGTPIIGLCGENGPITCAPGSIFVQWYDIEGKGTTLYSDSLLTDGEWHHIALTLNNQTTSLYADGQTASLQTSTDIPMLSPPLPDSIEGLQIGALISYTTPSHFFSGLLDEIRVWRIVRKREDIDKAKSRTLYPDYGLVYYWRLDEGIGTLIRSKAAVGYGTLGGGVGGSEPQWVISDSPLEAVEADELSQAEAASIGSGAFLGVFSLVFGFISGAWFMVYGPRYRFINPLVEYVKRQKVPLEVTYPQPTSYTKPKTQNNNV